MDEVIKDIYIILDKLCEDSTDPDVLQALSWIELYINNSMGYEEE